VAGVKVVVEKIEVKYSNSWAKKDDNEVATEIVNAFKWSWRIPKDKVKVEKGCGLLWKENYSGIFKRKLQKKL
jgi:hypothetical protein